MARLRQDYQKFIDRKAEIIVVGPEEAKSFTTWWHEHKMPFSGIPDPQHALARLYGQQVKRLKGGRLPALAVIDMGGRIRLMHYADATSDVPTNEKVLSLLDDLNKRP
jgi:peroxiredoxin Q/BCP